MKPRGGQIVKAAHIYFYSTCATASASAPYSLLYNVQLLSFYLLQTPNPNQNTRSTFHFLVSLVASYYVHNDDIIITTIIIIIIIIVLLYYV